MNVPMVRNSLGASTAVIGLLLMANPVAAAGGWLDPALVSAHMTAPSMVATSTGVEHMVARGDTGIWYLTDGSGAWTRTRLTQDHDDTSGGHVVHHFTASPLIALTGTSTLTVVYSVDSSSDADGGFCAPGDHLRYTVRQHGAWSTPKNIPGSRCQTATGLVSRGSTIALATSELAPNGARRISYFSNASGTWTHVTVASGFSSDTRLSPASLVLNARGKPMLAYLDGTHLMYARGATASGHFSHVKAAAATAANMQVPPSVALSSAGLPMIVWSQLNGTHYAYADPDGDWYAYRVMAGSVRSLLTFDSMNHAIIVAADGTGGLLYAIRSDGAWHTTSLDAHTTTQLGGVQAVGSSVQISYVRYDTNVYFESTYSGGC